MRQLRQSEDAFRGALGFNEKLLEVVPAGIYTCDAEGFITYFNQRAVDIWGREPKLNDPEDRFCGSFKLFWPDGSPIRHDQCWMAVALQTGEPYESREVIIERSDGSRVTVLAQIHPLHDERDKLIGAVNVLVDITERKRVEDALRKSERELTDFIETATLGLHQVGPDGIIQWANRAELQMLGYAPDEYIGHHISEFHEDQQAIETLLSRLHQDERVHDFEAVMRAKDGSLRHVLIDSSVLWEREEFKHTCCFTRDVTERKRAEQGLALYREVIANSSEAIAIIDLTGHYLEQNAAHQALTGYSDEELRGKTPAIHLGDEVFAAIARDLETHGGYRGEVVSRRKDGTQLDLDLTAFVVQNAEDEPVCYVGIKRDITERKKAEEAKARLAAIVESAEDAIISKDLNSIIHSWNRGAERIFGYTEEEAIGQPITILMPPERLDEEPAILGRIRQGESVEHYETVRRRKDGALLDISLSVSPIIDAQGHVVGASHIARDITERKRQEERLREADRQKDQFLAMLSHELRNPLGIIHNSVELLRLDQEDASIQQEALGILDRQVSTLTRLVDDLLDVSRVTTGRIQLQRADIDLNVLVQGVADSFRPQMTERRHEFSVSLADSPLWVHADPTRLEQVVVNLLSNATKYTPDVGRIWLTVHQERSEAVLRVKDTGIGIAPELLNHIFDLFSQGEQGLDRGKSGLGIGLALVKGLVEMHGGTITAISEGPGKGSEFVIRLPVIPLPREEQPPQSSAEDRKRNMVGLRVLVVDDSRDAVALLSVLLRQYGYEVQTALDGPTALQAALDFRPDVAILDIGLPGMSGYEVAQRMHQEEALRNVVLIAMTGYSQNRDIRRAREAGFDHHLIKPAEFAELRRILDSIL